MHPVQENSRWPRVSKFTLSACAATVAELGRYIGYFIVFENNSCILKYI